MSARPLWVWGLCDCPGYTPERLSCLSMEFSECGSVGLAISDSEEPMVSWLFVRSIFWRVLIVRIEPEQQTPLCNRLIHKLFFQPLWC